MTDQENSAPQTFFAIRDSAGRGWQMFVCHAPENEVPVLVQANNVDLARVRIIQSWVQDGIEKRITGYRPLQGSGIPYLFGWGDWVLDPSSGWWSAPDEQLAPPNTAPGEFEDYAVTPAYSEDPKEWILVRIGNSKSFIDILNFEVIECSHLVINLLDAVLKGEYRREVIGGPAGQVESLEVHPLPNENVRLIGRVIRSDELCHPPSLDIVGPRCEIVQRTYRGLQGLLEAIKEKDPNEYEELMDELPSIQDVYSETIETWLAHQRAGE